MAGRFKLRVHEPCSEPWGSMAGDDRRRFCGRCSLHVHDLSAMREEAVMKLIAGPDPHLCIRYSVRDDGTAVIGESRLRRALRVVGLIAREPLVLGDGRAGAAALAGAHAQVSPVPSPAGERRRARARGDRGPLAGHSEHQKLLGQIQGGMPEGDRGRQSVSAPDQRSTTERQHASTLGRVRRRAMRAMPRA